MKKLLPLFLCVLFLVGCAGTGLGRAWDQAWYGTPPEVVEAVQFMDKTMSEELRAKYAAIEAASVTDPKTGEVNKEWAEARFRDLETTHLQIERWNQLCQALATYLNASLDKPADYSVKVADYKRQEFWKAVEGAARALQEAGKSP